MSVLVNLRMCHTVPLPPLSPSLPPPETPITGGRSSHTLLYSTLLYSYPLLISGEIQVQIPPKIVQHLLLPGVSCLRHLSQFGSNSTCALISREVKRLHCAAYAAYAWDQTFGSIILSTRFQHDPLIKRMLNIPLFFHFSCQNASCNDFLNVAMLICQLFVATVPRS